MTTLDRHYAGQLLGVIWRTLLALLLLYIVIDLMAERRADIMRHDVPMQIVLQYYAYLAPMRLYQLAPLSVLIAGLMVLGNAAQNNEVTAALSGGISLRRFVRWPIVIAVLAGAAIFGLQEFFGASSFAQAEHIDDRYFERGGDTERTGVSWANLEDGWTCHIIKYNREADKGEQVYMYAIRKDAIEQIHARRIYWHPRREQWLLEDGVWRVFAPDAGILRESRRITQAEAPIERPPERLFALEVRAEAKSARQLREDISGAQAVGMPARGSWVSYHAKFSYPFLTFVMMMLAIPFAMQVRRGGLAISFGLSIGIAIAYLLVYGACLSLGHIGQLPPLAAAWLANIVFLAGALVMFYRVPT